jgi:uncharacterized protein YndB with AHSA1/START domain
MSRFDKSRGGRVRSVGVIDGGGIVQDFEMTIYIKADPMVVWEAITGDEGSRAVMFGSVLRGELEPGGRYEYVGPGEGGDETVHVYGDVLQADPGVVLQLTEHPRVRSTARTTPSSPAA